MSAVVTSSGAVRQLDRRPEPEEQVTEADAQDPQRLARLLMRILKDVAILKRRFWPRRIDYEARVVDATGSTKYRFVHGFKGPVRWWPVDWQLNATAFAGLGVTGLAGSGPMLSRDKSSDNNTLFLVSYSPGTVTIRVEEAGSGTPALLSTGGGGGG